MKSKRHKSAFTLIELMIVITIIGILAVALIPRITGGPARARDAQRKTDLSEIAGALESYASDSGGSYPANPTTKKLFACMDLMTSLKPYMIGESLPSDPSGDGVATGSINCTTNYTYMPLEANGVTVPNGYMLFAELENESLADDSAYVLSFPGSLSNTQNAAENFLTLSLCDVGDCSVGAMYVIGR